MKNSINNILLICGSVVFFSAISGIVIAKLPLEPITKSILSSILEMTGGVREISSLHLDLATRLIISSAVVGFAGICVHLQVISVVSEYNLSLFPYFAGKILHGLLSALYIFLLLKIFPVSLPAFAQKGELLSLGFYIASIFATVSVIFFLIPSMVTYISAQKKAV